mmetsp:Transcript_115/g.100  ORF Transcript_115/g.100 Transcript_115/m.100 type:complete len:221 (+) Transcript_115:45-707(+)
MLNVSSFTSTNSSASSSRPDTLDSIVDVTKFLQEELGRTSRPIDDLSEEDVLSASPQAAGSNRSRSQSTLQYHAVEPHSLRQNLRSARLPFDLMGATMVGPVAKPKRAAWNRKLATFIRIGRVTARDFPRKYKLIQKTSDVCVPGVGKKGVCCWKPSRPQHIRLQWYWPSSLTPTLKTKKDFQGFNNIEESAAWYRALQSDQSSPVILYLHGGSFVMCTH